MKVIRLALLTLITCVFITWFFGCSTPYEGPVADLVVKNAKIVTIDKTNPRAQAVAVIGETIIAVTSNRKIGQYIDPEKTKVIDAGGKLLIPGFNDAHLHFMGGGNSLMNLDFRYMTDIKKIQQMVKERAAEVGQGILVQGRSWDHELFPDKKWPTKEILDEVAPKNPVVLSRTDGHSCWVNSYVLRTSGISKNTPDPQGGTIVRDPETGEPTGILKEAAQGLVKIPQSARYSEEQQARQNRLSFEKGFEAARRLGVTSFSHLNGNWDLLQEFKDEGKLTARVTFNLWLTDDEKRLQEFDEIRKQYPLDNDWIRHGYLKAFIDGTLGSGTALMFEPFEDDPSTSGLPQMSYEELEKKIIAADMMGFQVGVHAIGTKGNNWILNAYEKAAEVNGKRDSRHRSEHAQILTDEDILRFGELGVIASMQPTHCITDKRFAEKRIGLDRCKGAYAWQRLLKSGAHVAFGTDWPVEPLDPMEGLYAAVSRKDRDGEEGGGWFPDQKLSMEKAIELYTFGAAYAEFTEERKGMLKEDYLADMIILDRDLMEIPHDDIMKTKVDLTIVGGKIVYQRE